ncbi:Hypothetical protein EAG7_03656 [Klebsiella aerogenes]|nr:Hypothetical protein EAG7_03656 [Klebsiella aerogenes]PVF75208.1 hypothetical protein CSC18_4637 [Klebsiella aerogenes]CCG32151.1 hypothetical protein [Klebsiella aerogenes EA1509E]
MGDLKLTNNERGIFLNNCIRKGRYQATRQRLQFNQWPDTSKRSPAFYPYCQ